MGRAQAQLSGLGVGVVLRVLSGWAQAHPPDVAPKPVSELKTCSRAFMCYCIRCSLALLCQGSRGRNGRSGRRRQRSKCGRSSRRGHLS
jgi:hypothetical protein